MMLTVCLAEEIELQHFAQESHTFIDSLLHNALRYVTYQIDNNSWCF